jgi:hypothetical protein
MNALIDASILLLLLKEYPVTFNWKKKGIFLVFKNNSGGGFFNRCAVHFEDSLSITHQQMH